MLEYITWCTKQEFHTIIPKHMHVWNHGFIFFVLEKGDLKIRNQCLCEKGQRGRGCLLKGYFILFYFF